MKLKNISYPKSNLPLQLCGAGAAVIFISELEVVITFVELGFGCVVAGAVVGAVEGRAVAHCSNGTINENN